jgi:hypothetical protein
MNRIVRVVVPGLPLQVSLRGNRRILFKKGDWTGAHEK